MSIAACVKEVLLAASKNYWWLRQEQVAVHKKAIAGGAMPRQRAMPGWAKELLLAAPKSYCWRLPAPKSYCCLRQGVNKKLLQAAPKSSCGLRQGVNNKLPVSMSKLFIK